MNQWPFVIAAYSIATVATLGVTGWALIAMRSAEAAAEALRRK